MIFLVRRLRTGLGVDIEDLSVKRLNERIKRDKHGINLEADELPTARYQQWLIDNPPPATLRVYRKGILREAYPEEKETVADRLTSWQRRRVYQKASQSGSHHSDEQAISYELLSFPSQGGEEAQIAPGSSFVSQDESICEDTDSISVVQTTTSTDVVAISGPVQQAIRERTVSHSRE
jgi:hypothetical protein